jgi:hypothetical protein
VNFLLDILPRTTGSMTTTMSLTPSRPDTTLRRSPIPLSDEAGGLALDHFGPLVLGASIDPGGPLPQMFLAADAHLHV